ncbi:MAG TPA: hypothetical protein VL651_07830 [Bacteroidia bacterium]|jgi:hypothetical protein|nr:hypothetical protein [Bacteroidia bacterium]
MNKTATGKTLRKLFRLSLRGVCGMLFAVVFLFTLHSFTTTSSTKNYLYTAVYDQQAATNHIVHIYRVPFENGVAGGQESVMDVLTQGDGDAKPKIRFDLGPSTIYRNRYVITSYGNVIDLKEKKVLVDAHDQFMKASGDSIVFYVNDIFRGQFYCLLDLKTGTYSEIKSASYRITTNKDVQPDCSLKNYKIYYYPVSSDKVELVRDAGFGEDVTFLSGAKHQLPIQWIDADDFLYPNYSSDHSFVTIMKVSVSNQTEDKIGTIDNLPENHSYSLFYKDPEGTIVYRCSRGDFSIDAQKKKVTELTYLSAGNGFSVAVNEVKPKGREILNSGTSIGNYYCDPSQAVSTNGLIAFPYEIVLGDEHYLQGYAVWSSATGKWKNLGDSDLAAVIGWTQE